MSDDVQGLREEVRRLRDDIRRIKAGEIPSDRLTLGTGQTDTVKIMVRSGARFVDATADVGHPALIFSPDANGVHAWRRSNDGVTTDEITTQKQAATPTDVAALNDRVVAVASAASSSGGQFVELALFRAELPLGITLNNSTWTQLSTRTMLLQGGFFAPSATATYRVSMWASIASGTAQVRYRDITNGQTLWTVTGITTTPSFKFTEAVSNWPAGDARIEPEGLSSAASADIAIHSATWWMYI